ncbi:phage holin family protein [Aliishimia ponticola]|uniref:Phage holin family protein n=1 Tax=Aliishimia ponticola TaxID=2499833 RepID=A0A4S4NH30_9RHOB|nr:phage holin family protein [Aliishimia ponticola]THH38145.1 phage holin family protein [Aliishimia ponticola]
MSDRDPRSTLAVLVDVLRQSAGLAQSEVQLAKAEIGENLSRAALAIGLMLAAAVMAMISLNLLAGTLVTLLIAWGLSATAAALIVCAVFGLVAVLLVMKAMSDLRASSLAPTKAMASMRRDAHAIREHAHG